MSSGSTGHRAGQAEASGRPSLSGVLLPAGCFLTGSFLAQQGDPGGWQVWVAVLLAIVGAVFLPLVAKDLRAAAPTARAGGIGFLLLTAGLCAASVVGQL
jgi:hypothetical protein